jgi:hypothetical protein
MDDHVKQMSDLTALITEVRSQTTIQTQRLSAQLDGLRSTMDSNTNTTKADLVDIRGRIVPDLREHTTATASQVKRLEDRLDDYPLLSLTVACLEERLDTFREEFDGYTTQHPRASTPPDNVDDPPPHPTMFPAPASRTSTPFSVHPHPGTRGINHVRMTTQAGIPVHAHKPLQHPPHLRTTRLCPWGGA